MPSDSTLLTCPRCKQPNFTRAGLRTHRCRGIKPTDERRPLTAAELAEASSGSTAAVSNPAQAIAQRERMSTGQDAAIAEQLVTQYRKAERSPEVIAQAQLDLVIFGGMLAQLESELAAQGGPRRGPGAKSLTGWIAEHAPEIPQQRASELKALAAGIAKHFELEVGTLQHLLTAGPETVLAKGQGKIRGKILEALGAGSIHRLHMEFGSRKHGGSREAAIKPLAEAPTLEEKRQQAYRDLGRMISDLTLQIATDSLYTMWLTAEQLELMASNLSTSVVIMRDRAKTMRTADGKGA